MTTIFAFGFLIVLLLIAATQVPKLWRHDKPFWDSSPAWWPLGQAVWRAWTRALPTIFVLGGILIVLGIVAFFLPTNSKGAVPHWYGALLLALFGVLLVLVLSLMAFGRPRALVPPHLRGGGAAGDIG